MIGRTLAVGVLHSARMGEGKRSAPQRRWEEGQHSSTCLHGTTVRHTPIPRLSLHHVLHLWTDAWAMPEARR